MQSMIQSSTLYCNLLSIFEDSYKNLGSKQTNAVVKCKCKVLHTATAVHATHVLVTTRYTLRHWLETTGVHR